ncbi:MAG TPA: hypothetical protein VG013_36190 [Gemmataceae bacterium]|jgi:hypothetical protein|nr:hypothetical protein [Gemmataceae bacterium]
MRRTIPIIVLLLAFVVPAWAAAQGDRGERRGRVPDLDGTWYMNGDEDLPCQIIQRRLDGRAEFINEHGDRAAGTVRGDHVYIPDWTDGRGSRGLRGTIRRDRIIWPDGSYWSR